jgi:hypothetical protein
MDSKISLEPFQISQTVDFTKGIHVHIEALPKQYIDGIIEQALEMEGKQKKLDLTNINRLEVINHASNSHRIGRILTMYKETEDFTVVDAEFQDGHRTLKIFIS